jgi:hypothetical protein
MRMIRISVEISYASGPFRVMVEAECIRRAVERIQRCYPGCEVKPVFPIDPETFFVDEVAKVRQVGPWASGRRAA